MTEQDSDRFGQLVADAGIQLNQEISPELIELLWRQFASTFKFEVIERAFNEHISGSEYWPKPAEIRTLAWKIMDEKSMSGAKYRSSYCSSCRGTGWLRCTNLVGGRVVDAVKRCSCKLKDERKEMF